MLAVKATDLTKKYGRYYGIDNVNISVETGDVFGIVGPKGAGKTTLLRLLMNYIFPTAGSGSIYGNDIVANAAIIKETTGYVPTEVTCYPQMKAGKYIKTAMKMHGVRNNAAMVKLIDKFDVPRNQTFEVMDRVDAKTTGIVAALAIKPKVLLLDEPTKGLDSSYRSILFDLLIEEHEKGTTIVITAETIEELAGFCNRIAIIEEGSVVEIKEYDGNVYVDETAVTDFTDEFSDYEEIEETEENNPLEDTIPLNIEETPVLSSDLDADKLDADKSDIQNADLNGVDLGVSPISSPTGTEALNQVPMAAAAVENLPVKEEPKYVEASIEDFLAEPEIIEEKPTEDFLAETEIIAENPTEKSAENNGEIAATTEPITEEKPSLLNPDVNTDVNTELNTDVPQDEKSPTMATEEFSAENKETPKPTTEVKETADTANEPVANNSETVINNTELADNKPQSGSAHAIIKPEITQDETFAQSIKDVAVKNPEVINGVKYQDLIDTKSPKSFTAKIKKPEKQVFEDMGMAVMSEEKGKIKLAFAGNLQELQSKLSQLGITDLATQDALLAQALGIENEKDEPCATTENVDSSANILGDENAVKTESTVQEENSIQGNNSEKTEKIDSETVVKTDDISEIKKSEISQSKNNGGEN